MGLTGDYVIALAGNPNTGKSTVFNALTGLNQHTGNWPGKTVASAKGVYTHNNKDFVLVDLPGTYSLLANSVEEQVARDFLCFDKPDATVIVVDATCLERNLNLVLQVLEITPRSILCLNLLDEAKRKKISIDVSKLQGELGIPVVPTVARDGKGLLELKETVKKVASGALVPTPRTLTYPENLEANVGRLTQELVTLLPEALNPKWLALRFLEGDESVIENLREYLPAQSIQDLQTIFGKARRLEETYPGNVRDEIVSTIFKEAEQIYSAVVSTESDLGKDWDYKIDNILTSKVFGYPLMLLLLGGVFWLTVAGANYPSQLLATGLFWVEEQLSAIFSWLGTPDWLHGILVLGLFRSLAWVVSVMLPPMAIFFPLFTLLEDLGYLPRIAFNLDGLFKKAGTHGKQALTMAMGFGCNAAGVVAARIIDSPRERLIAILTNNFVPCNGRFPTLIALAAIFFGGGVLTISSEVLASGMVAGLVLIGITITLLVSWMLSQTILKGVPSSFSLELPPYRKPQVGRILVRSIFDRTLFVLRRAVVIAAPAGAITWLMANTFIGDLSLIDVLATWLQPFAQALGLDGYILLAFILGLPANEIVIPILIMSYLGAGAMLELDSLSSMKELFMQHGWTWLTALNTMLFSLLHFPCATTLLVMKNETGGFKWPLIAAAISTTTAVVVCFLVAQVARILGLV